MKMNIERLKIQIKVLCIRSSQKRTLYMKNKKIFHACGKNVILQSRFIPLYPNLIAFHNNIRVASNVSFVTHDVVDRMLNIKNNGGYLEKIGCIEVMDNVFIGANSMIMYGTRIGRNVIVAAGSIVTKDIPSNEIWGGVPARKIGVFDDIERKRYQADYPRNLMPKNQKVSKQLEKIMWDKFYQEREEKKI